LATSIDADTVGAFRANCTFGDASIDAKVVQGAAGTVPRGTACFLAGIGGRDPAEGVGAVSVADARPAFSLAAVAIRPTFLRRGSVLAVIAAFPLGADGPVGEAALVAAGAVIIAFLSLLQEVVPALWLVGRPAVLDRA